MYSTRRMFMRFLRKGMGARTVRQGLTRMQGYIVRGRCKNFIRGRPCHLGLPRVSNLLKPSIICAARGRHCQRQCKNFIRGGSFPLGLPRGANLLKPSVIRAARGRHRQRAMQKFYPRRALPPRASPRRKSLETIYHSRCKGKASPEGDAKISSEAGLAPSGSPAAQIS